MDCSIGQYPGFPFLNTRSYESIINILLPETPNDCFFFFQCSDHSNMGGGCTNNPVGQEQELRHHIAQIQANLTPPDTINMRCFSPSGSARDYKHVLIYILK